MILLGDLPLFAGLSDVATQHPKEQNARKGISGYADHSGDLVGINDVPEESDRSHQDGYNSNPDFCIFEGSIFFGAKSSVDLSQYIVDIEDKGHGHKKPQHSSLLLIKAFRVQINYILYYKFSYLSII